LKLNDGGGPLDENADEGTPNAGSVDGGGRNAKPLDAADVSTVFVAGFVVVSRPNNDGAFDEPKDESDETEPNVGVLFEWVDEIIFDTDGLSELPAPNANGGLLGVVVVVADENLKPGTDKPLIPNEGVAVEVNVKLFGIEKALVVEGTKNEEVVAAAGNAVGNVEGTNMFGITDVVAVVKDGAEVFIPNENGAELSDKISGTAGVVVVIGVVPNVIGLDTCSGDGGMFGVTGLPEDTVELVAAVVKLDDGDNPKLGIVVPAWKGLLALVVNDLSQVVVPNKCEAPDVNEGTVVTGFSLVVDGNDTVGAALTKAGAVNVNGVLLDIGFSLLVVVVIPNEGVTTVDTEFSLIVDGIGVNDVEPNSGKVALVVAGALVVIDGGIDEKCSLVVDGNDTIGAAPNEDELANVALVDTGFSWFILVNDENDAVLNGGKVILGALVVAGGGIDKTFSLVVAGVIVWSVVVTDVDIFGSLTVKSGNLLGGVCGTDCFSIVIVGSIAK
jgi:hypothetical protein